MHSQRDHPTKAVNIVSIILTIAIVIMSLGLILTIFPPSSDSGGSSLPPKVETGTETDTENDKNNEADTDTENGDNTVIEASSVKYEFNSLLEGVTYSDNVDQENLWVKTEALNGNDALYIGKSTTSSTAQKVWLDLSSVDTTRNKQVFEFYFLWQGSENGLSGLDNASTEEWYTTFSLMSANLSLLNISLRASEENKDTYSIIINNTFRTTGYPINEWCNIRIEIENTIANVYVNDSLVRGVSCSNTASGIDTFEIKHRGYVVDTNLYVDNVSFTTTN